MIHVPLLGGVIRGGVDGVDTRAVSFLLCACFELGALALVAKWSSRSTCLVAIASKPPKPKPSFTFVNKAFEMCEKIEVWGVPG